MSGFRRQAAHDRCIALLALAAIVALAGAGLWHHHDHDEAPDHGAPRHCAVCVAIVQDREPAGPPAQLSLPALLELGVAPEPTTLQPVLRSVRRPSARDPPRP